MTRIAVLGATGYLGGYAVSRLLSDGYDVRAVVRSPQKAELPKTIEVQKGDVTDLATLHVAFSGVDGVLLALNGGSDPERVAQVEEQGIANVVEAAEAAGVSRVILLSGMFSQPKYAEDSLEQSKARGERLLMESRIPSTVFRIGFINETLAKFLRGGHPVLFGHQPHMIRPVAADDIMATVSRAFRMPETANRIYEVAGDQEMTLRQAISAYAEAITGKKFSRNKVWVIPLGFLQMVNRLFLRGGMTRELSIMASINRHGDVTDTSDWFKDFGAPQTAFTQWVAWQRASTTDKSSS